MYLKSIKLKGFKSFADNTNILFNKEITAIVGPNGSGKSNIVDAVRWVLGEQSAKSLRASSGMSDVIFSGSKTRDELKKASVSLVFDNSDNYLNSEFNEVEIKREVYKTGENDYFINGAKVRLKDVHELFLDKGAGQNAFNIISQGNIVDIVNYKPLERRILFESAAGVLKYKKRKEEAIRKLDRTKINISSIRLVIDELSETVLPLKKQSEDAKKYLEIKDDLVNTEIALIANDIEEYNKRYNDLKYDLENLYDDLKKADSFVDLKDIEALKLENLKLDDNISKLNYELIKINDNLSTLNSDKLILEERSKFKIDKETINENILTLKNKEAQLKKDVNVYMHELNDLNKKSLDNKNSLSNLEDKLLSIKLNRTNTNNYMEDSEKRILFLKNKKEILEQNLLNKEGLPRSVRNILNNPLLKNIYNTIGGIIDIPIKYSTAINTALGFSSNFLVVKDFNAAKNAINYLKDNNLGRATFFPLDTIKSRYSNPNLNDNEFLGIASDLVEYDDKFRNIVENQLGNVLIVNDINSLNKIAKLTNYRYKIVSLDGDVSFPGGSISGGNESLNKDYKYELNKTINALNEEETKLNKLIKQYEEYNNEFINLNNKKESYYEETFKLNEIINNKTTTFNELKAEYESLEKELSSMDNIINNTLDKEIINLIDKISNLKEEKILLENNLLNLKDKKDDVQNNILTLENDYKIKNNEINNINSQTKEIEIELSKLEVKIENLLVNLSEEYELTYEAASEKYILDIDVNLARDKVKRLKRVMNKLGEVNTGSIKEYDRLKTRYEFLQQQEEDLLTSSEDLEEIILEMDEIMIDKFKESFEEVRVEYKKVFKDIFKGGRGDLYLTNPEDILNTGVEMIAIPPGKKITSTMALSGGEKSLAAISLLFAILNIKPVPFIILDEAEAALDEANVDLFGEYIREKQKNSQFILVTHKKRMMEYADVLYGVTMQESGVSKLVSAKLSD